MHVDALLSSHQTLDLRIPIDPGSRPITSGLRLNPRSQVPGHFPAASCTRQPKFREPNPAEASDERWVLLGDSPTDGAETVSTPFPASAGSLAGPSCRPRPGWREKAPTPFPLRLRCCGYALRSRRQPPTSPDVSKPETCLGEGMFGSRVSRDRTPIISCAPPHTHKGWLPFSRQLQGEAKGDGYGEPRTGANSLGEKHGAPSSRSPHKARHLGLHFHPKSWNVTRKAAAAIGE